MLAMLHIAPSSRFSSFLPRQFLIFPLHRSHHIMLLPWCLLSLLPRRDESDEMNKFSCSLCWRPRLWRAARVWPVRRPLRHLLPPGSSQLVHALNIVSIMNTINWHLVFKATYCIAEIASGNFICAVLNNRAEQSNIRYSVLGQIVRLLRSFTALLPLVISVGAKQYAVITYLFISDKTFFGSSFRSNPSNYQYVMMEKFWQL